MNKLCEELECAIYSAIEEAYQRKHYFGGNSGYVGYSKSKRACDAEERGLRSISNMDTEFKDAVNKILADENHKSVSLAYIKSVAKNVDADEWHHTSMYGNKTNYYSAETIANEILDIDKNDGLTSQQVDSINLVLSAYNNRCGSGMYLDKQDIIIHFNDKPLDMHYWTIEHFGYNKYDERITLDEIPLSQASNEEKRLSSDLLQTNKKNSAKSLEEWFADYKYPWKVSLDDVLNYLKNNGEYNNYVHSNS